jgi:ribosomal protein L40E
VRRPCDAVRLKRTLKLCSVLPVWSGTVGEYRVCRVCGAREGDIPPPAMEASIWRWPKCRNVNPAGATSCLGCGSVR